MTKNPIHKQSTKYHLNMNIFQKRIENLCDEIIGRILALMKVNSVSEVVLTDNDNPVYVIWFDKTGDPCECSVHKVTAIGEGITLEVYDKITGENYKVTSRHEAVLANPVWLNDILEAITNTFQIKNTGLEENVICCKCGENHVVCNAFINPNTKQFYNYDEESFLYGWCEKCDNYTILCDIEAVKNDIENDFKKFVKTYGEKPEIAECKIIWKDSLNTEYVNIAITDVPEEYDNTIFFYCKNLSELINLSDFSSEDFVLFHFMDFKSITL
ncbi:hypothetical protein K330107F9_34710 [Bacteroides stercoris]|jgi:hypothetical protein|nr:hypothetical protein [Bacteroides sp. AF20-13LB]